MSYARRRLRITFWLGIVAFFVIIFAVLWVMLGWKMFEPSNLDKVITEVVSVLVVFIAVAGSIVPAPKVSMMIMRPPHGQGWASTSGSPGSAFAMVLRSA